MANVGWRRRRRNIGVPLVPSQIEFEPSATFQRRDPLEKAAIDSRVPTGSTGRRMILVLFAVPQESRVFAGRLQHDCPAACGMIGSLGREEVSIVHTGMGSKAAAKAVERAIGEFRPAIVISSGFAGGLRAGLQAGELITAVNFTAPALVEALPMEVRRVVGTCSVFPVDTPQGKRELRDRTGADVVDLESEGISESTGRAGVPLLVLRIVSDSAEEALPLPSDVAYDFERQRVRTFAILKHLADHPRAIPPLIRFTRGLPVLQERLANALVRAIEALPAR
jgi:hypothetical protein